MFSSKSSAVGTTTEVPESGLIHFREYGFIKFKQ